MIPMALLGLVALVGFALVSPGKALAVVSDVTFTGGDPGPTTISITNEETGETVRGDREMTGAPVVIPVENRKWRAGAYYTITFTDPKTRKPVTVKNVELKDGRNRFDLGALLAMAGTSGGSGGSRGQMPSSIFDVHAGMRFFDIPAVGTSFGLRADYSPPIVFNEGLFSLTLPDAKITGALMAGIGWEHMSFHTKESNKAHFVRTDQFNTSDNAFRMEFNAGLAIDKDSYFIGLKGGVAPTVTNIFNGGEKLRWEGNLSLVGGLKF
jgi:hypothetical protein